MAITITREQSDRVFNIFLCGHFSEIDYHRVLPELQEAAKENGPIRLLLDVNHLNIDSSSWTWQQFFTVLGCSLGIERLAFVAEPPLRDRMRQFARSLKGAKIGYFAPDQCWVAQCWLGG